MSRNLTFDDFSKKLENMNQQCGSCKFLEYKGRDSYCEKHNKPRSNNDEKCEDWRYFA